MSRLFRIEMNEARRQSPDVSDDVRQILCELARQRAEPGPTDQVDNAIAMWSGVDDIQKRLEITRTEISALHEQSAAGENARAADELRAVVEGTEAATDTILEAAEAIDVIAQRHTSSDNDELKKDFEVVAAEVLRIFEACNFQDITGQRVSKVVSSLQFIEERIAAMVDVWKTMAGGLGGDAQANEPDAPNLLNGPALEGDRGVVTQDDVDALFP